MNKSNNEQTLKLVIKKFETYSYNKTSKQVEYETQVSGDNLVYAISVSSGFLSTLRINVDELS